MFDWTNDCQKAFEDLKKALITAPVLATFNNGKSHHVEIDASGTAVGAVLLQKQEPE